MSGYPLFIPGFVLSTNPSLFKFKIANEHREFRNYLSLAYIMFVESNQCKSFITFPIRLVKGRNRLFDANIVSVNMKKLIRFNDSGGNSLSIGAINLLQRQICADDC